MARPLIIAHCVETYPPAMGGMAEVVRQLSERLAAMGHHVTVLTTASAGRTQGTVNGVLVKGYAISGNAVDGLQGDTVHYLSELTNGGFDIITFFAAQQWSTDAALPVLAQLPAKKVFVPTGFSALTDPRWADYYARMPRWLKEMDLNIFLSHRYQDITFAEQHGLRNHTVIPNAASAEEFGSAVPIDIREELGITATQRIVLHVGSYTGIKGHREAIRIFLKARTPDTVMLMIGNGNAGLRSIFRRHYSYVPERIRAWMKGKRIIFVETDRAHTVAAMQQSDVFLFPSMIECSPLVLFEAMAARLPFISSRAGNAEEIVEWSGGGTTIPGVRDPLGREHVDVEQGASLLEDLLENTSERERMAEAGHTAWRAKFTWEIVARAYEKAYQDLMASGTGAL